MAKIKDGTKKRGLWTQDALSKAILVVKEKGLPVREACRRYGVPRRTLRRYLCDEKNVKAKLGCKPTLSPEQEQELCSRIFRLCDVGYPLTSKVLQLNIFRYCSDNNIPNKFVKGKAGRWWLEGFLKRNPEVAKRKAQSLNPARAAKLNRFIVTDHFDKLKRILLENNLMDFPEKIYNVDEKGCRLQLHKEPTVFAKKGVKRVHVVAKEHGESISVVACGNATGCVVPPMLLFKGVRRNPAWGRHMPTGADIRMTPKGSMTADTFVEFLKHFKRFKPGGKCLLIFDGAKSHLDYKICEVAEENDILLYCLPSNTTHELQPLDKGCFRSFEIYWDQHALLYFDVHKDENDISKLNFGDVFTPTWEKSMSQGNMKSGFRATGIYPFNPLIIPDEAFAPSAATELPLPEPATDEQDIAEQIPPESTFANSTPGTSGSSQLPLSRSKPVTVTSESHKYPRVPAMSSTDSADASADAIDSSDDGEHEMSQTPDSSAKSSTSSFTEMFPTPLRKKKTARNKKPAINSRGLLLSKRLFQDIETCKQEQETKKITTRCKRRNTKENVDNINQGRGKTKKKLTPTHTESWYCTVCGKDEVKDMRRCAACGEYVHEECVGLCKDDKEMFVCPTCHL